MQNYQISVSGMHCKGCTALIKMSMEDEGFAEVNVDIQTKLAVFTTSLDMQSVIKQLQAVFAGLPGYAFNNLQLINS